MLESNLSSDLKCVRHDLMIDAVSSCFGWTYLPIRTRHSLSDTGIFVSFFSEGRKLFEKNVYNMTESEKHRKTVENKKKKKKK